MHVKTFFFKMFGLIDALASLLAIEFLLYFKKYKYAKKICASKSKRYGFTSYFSRSLGNIYEREGNAKEASIAYEKAYNVDPTDYIVMFELGNLYYKEMNFDKAIPLFEKLANNKMNLHKNDALLHAKLGVMYRLEGRNNEALEEYQKAKSLGINPTLKQGLLDAIERTKLDVEFKKFIEQL